MPAADKRVAEHTGKDELTPRLGEMNDLMVEKVFKKDDEAKEKEDKAK